MVTTEWLLIGGGAVVSILALLGVGYLYQQERRRAAKAVNKLTEPRDEGPGDDAALSAPDLSGGLWDLISVWRHRQKAKKMAQRGYVRWYKIDSQFSEPKWVKPEMEGAGVYEYYDTGDDTTYFFPQDAMLHDEATGAWTAVHRRGEVDPINLADPMMPPIPGDRMEELIQLEAESDAPSFWDRMDISAQSIMWVAIGGFLLMGAVMQFMGGA